MNPSHTRLPTSRRLLWLLVIALALTCPSRAPAAPEPTPEKGRTDSPAPHAPVDPLNRRTPRDAMAGFLDATRHRDYVRAAEFLDLRRLPAATHAQDGPTLARQLRIVLDQVLAPDPEALSDEEDSSRRDGLPPDRELVGTIKGKAGSTPIVLQRVQGDGDTKLWKISAATVAQIPRLYREYGYGPLGTICLRPSSRSDSSIWRSGSGSASCCSSPCRLRSPGWARSSCCEARGHSSGAPLPSWVIASSPPSPARCASPSAS